MDFIAKGEFASCKISAFSNPPSLAEMANSNNACEQLLRFFDLEHFEPFRGESPVFSMILQRIADGV